MNNNYFNNRNVNKNFYNNYILPNYFKKVLPSDKNVNILDIGCGLGQTLLALKKNEYNNIYGIDINEEAIKICINNKLNVEKINSIINYANVSKRKFDLIIMSHVLEHIEKKEIIKTLNSIKKNLLAENGKFLLMVPNAQSNTGCYWAYEDFTHTTLFTAGSMIYVLKSAGFSNIKFLDPDNSEFLPIYKKVILKILLNIYKFNLNFWNKVTASSFHKPSPIIFSFELRVLATNDK